MRLTSLAAALAICLPGPLAAQDITANELAPNVYQLWGGFYGSLAVIGEDGVLITDPANAWRAGLMKVEIAKITDKPVTKIVLTHEHFDHTGGTEVFEGAQIYAQRNAEAVFKFDPMGLAPDRVDVVFDDALEIDLGTTTVTLKHFGAADGVATTVVHLPAEKIVATADLYDENALTLGAFLDDKNMLGARAVLNEVAGWDMTHAVNAHSADTDPAILRANARYYNDLYDAVAPTVEKTAAENPAGLWELPSSLPETVKLPAYENWSNYDQLPHHVRRMVLALIHGG